MATYVLNLMVKSGSVLFHKADERLWMGMAKDGNASKDMIEYIKENLSIEKALA